jgi:hypothetical protein
LPKFCIFCGQRPEHKTREHVIPRWLIETTGDPKRQVSFGTHNWRNEEPKTFAFDQLTFPACESCNREFSGLEDKAKQVVESMLAKSPLAEIDFSIILDWLDKVRIGIWLGLMQLEDNPWGINPKFHISQRLAMHDRSIAIGLVKDRRRGVNLIGPESPCFGFAPTTFCLLVNDLALFNSSSIGLCSRRLGFPFPTEYKARADGMLEGSLAPGLERTFNSVERSEYLRPLPFIYQPIFRLGLPADSSPADPLNSQYVRSHSLNFQEGLGRLFLQKRGSVSMCQQAPSMDWLPDDILSLPEVYKSGRRWTYRKLVTHYRETSGGKDPRLPVFHDMHERLIAFYDRELGL